MKIRKYLKFQLKLNKGVLIGWSIGIFAFMFLYMILFPSVKDIAQAELDVMPKEILELFGMSSLNDMSNFVSFFGIIFNIILIAISAFFANFGAQLIYKEEQTRSIEFVNSLELSRSKIYFTKLLTGIIGIIFIVLAALSSALIAGFVNGGESFVLEDILKITLISSFIPFFFLSVGFLLAGITTKIATPLIATLTLFGTYLLGYLGSLLGTNAEFLKSISLFQVLNTNTILEMSNKTLITLAVYFALSILFIIIGKIFYKKRDFNI